jgi:hypothetical protein
MNEDWTQYEVGLIVEDYFNMLQLELRQEKYNKTEYRKGLLSLLGNRSNGSIEFKHQNISAVLRAMGLPFIKGYKPLANFQQLLWDKVADYLKDHHIILEQDFERFADTSRVETFTKIDFETIIDTEPEISEIKEDEPAYRPIKINYLEKEQNNRNLGEEGEKLVIAYEQFRLIKAGKEKLADKIEWVSKEKGDGTGYDILSKNIDGTDRFVEVKTTKLTKETPIYMTKTEIGFASLNAKDFYLYRVFNFNSTPKLFIKNGEYRSFCKLLPQTYKGYF